ncbi:unnamed protein product [Effrenium voratum]|nr:unnamed protein product [Effrenium voratum]
MWWLLWSLAASVAGVHVPLDDESTALVQRSASRRQPMLQAAAPLKYLHVPKSGTSFWNIVIQTDGICPDRPAGMIVDEASLGGHPEASFLMMCPAMCDQKMLSCNRSPHEEMGGENWTRYKGHLVAMFRDPRQRICSSYYDPEFDFVGDVTAEATPFWRLRAKGANGVPLPHRMSLQEYAPQRFGDATKQLTRFGSSLVIQGGEPATAEESRLATARVREGFAFVGITEEWSLSVCLFRRMFGGQCMPSDFEDMRPHSPGETAAVIYEDADTIADPYDMPVYEEAVRVFKENLVKYDVSEETCKACFAAKR